MNDLQPVALGTEPADLVVTDGTVYSSSRGGFLDRDIAVVGDRIASLPADATPVTAAETTVVSAGGGVVVPGFVDAHTHVDIHVTPERACPALLESGTTAVVTEVSGLGAFGSRGVDAFLDATGDLPVSVFPTVPPQPLVNTFEPATADRDEADELAALLSRDRVVGVGEVDWIHVVGRSSPVDGLHDRAREAGKPIVGHGAGCGDDALAAFATVVDNDHEAISVEGIRDRATHGIHVVGRCGSIRDDLDALVEAIEADDVDPDSTSLSTDGVWVPDLQEGFGMAEVVRRTIEGGIEPTDAIDMATRQPADHFGIDDRGRLEPGAIADLVVVDDRESMAVETVVAGGDVVVERGDATIDPPAADYPSFLRDAVSIPTEPTAFTVPVDEAPGGRVRGLAVERGLVTTETAVEPARDGDRYVADPGSDVLTATLLDRDPNRERDAWFTGFIAGYGLEAGAIAVSTTWEVPGVVIVAADAGDAGRAAERIESMGGGWALVRDGTVVADLPMPIAGAASDARLREIAAGFESVESALRDLGVDVDRPLLTPQTLTFLGVPAMKLTTSGYADIFGRSVVGLDPEAE